MAASGRTEVASDVKFGVGASSSSTSGPNLVILSLIMSKRTRRHDGDGDDGVRGLCYKRLRQLCWTRALKTEADWLNASVRVKQNHLL